MALSPPKLHSEREPSLPTPEQPTAHSHRQMLSSIDVKGKSENKFKSQSRIFTSPDSTLEHNI
jgi:hypothetical protein